MQKMHCCAEFSEKTQFLSNLHFIKSFPHFNNIKMKLVCYFNHQKPSNKSSKSSSRITKFPSKIIINFHSNYSSIIQFNLGTQQETSSKLFTILDSSNVTNIQQHILFITTIKFTQNHQVHHNVISIKIINSPKHHIHQNCRTHQNIVFIKIQLQINQCFTQSLNSNHAQINQQQVS